MLHVAKMVSIGLLLVTTSVAIGQTVDSDERSTRFEYDRSPDLPNGVVFYTTLFVLDQLGIRFGPAVPAQVIPDELKLSNVESHAFVSQALTTRYFIDEDIRAQNERIGCEYTRPGVSKQDQYSARQQIHDSNNAIQDHYYEQTKASLDTETGERLQKWMDERKLKTVQGKGTDYEKSGRDPAVYLLRFCEGHK